MIREQGPPVKMWETPNQDLTGRYHSTAYAGFLFFGHG